jgi:hypothetical protein
MLPELRTNLPAIISEPALPNYSFQVRTQREIDGYYDFAAHLSDCRIKAYSRPLELRAALQPTRRPSSALLGSRMTKPSKNPSKERMKAMTLDEIDLYIRNLRAELQWRTSGPVHKTRAKQLEVATKVRALNFPDARPRR